MKIEAVQAYYVERTATISRAELIERSGLTEDELRALVDSGAVVPDDPHAVAATFTVECLTIARTAHRLREELALEDAHALSVVLRFAQRVTALEDELAHLRARLIR